MNDSEFILWTILNSIVLLYAILLFIYGKFIRKNEILSLVNIIFNIYIIFKLYYLLQKSYPEENKTIREEESIRPDSKLIVDEDKNANLIEN